MAQQREPHDPRRRAGALLAFALLAACACGGGAQVKTQPAELSTSQKLRLVESYMTVGRIGDALKTIDEAIIGEPQSPQLHLTRAGICFKAGRYAEAEASLVESLRLDPRLTYAYTQLGAVLQESGRLGEAEAAYRKALEDPAYPEPQTAYLGLGVLYSKQGRDREAIDAFRKAVEIDPKYYQGHWELAGALERVGNMVEAAREYEVAEPGFRNVGEYHFRRGMAYFRLGEQHKAREQLLRVIDISPGSRNAAKADELLAILDQG